MSGSNDNLPLVKNEEGDINDSVEAISGHPPPPYEPVLIINEKSIGSKPLKKLRQKRCVFLLMGLTFMAAIVAAVFIFMWFLTLRDRHPRRIFRECEVIFPEEANIPYGLPHRLHEEVEVNKNYARIHLPALRNTNLHQPAITVLHLLEKNVTIIKKSNVCYVKPLRSQLHSLHINPNMHHQKQGMTLEGHLTNEHWFVSRTAIPPAMFFFTYEFRAMQLCSKVPILRLISRSEYENGVHQEPINGEMPLERGHHHHHGHHPHHHPGHHDHHHHHHHHHHNCTEKECVDERCPMGFVRRMDVHGCFPDCSCMPEPGLQAGVVIRGILCPILNYDNCPLRCFEGYKKDPASSCEICECSSGLAKPVFRRSIAEKAEPIDVNENTCPIKETIFEGVVLGDDRCLAPVNYVHSCEPHEA
jgi:hypothetical protein